MSARYQERLSQIEKVLLIQSTSIDVCELRKGCLYGIPDLLRPLAWRLLLNYLPTDRTTWKQFLKSQRSNYDVLVEQLVVEPGPSGASMKEESHDDHPLSDNSGSEWNAFFDDNTVLTQIDKDVRRLCPEIQFFQLRTKYPHKKAASINLSKRVCTDNLHTEDFDISRSDRVKKGKRSDVEYAIVELGQETHWQVVERILFIYAKLNPGVKYVQGMNEVLGPLYYVLASDPDSEWAEFAEADAFFCFQQLMCEIKDNFIKVLDSSTCGIEHQMSQFYSLLQTFDPELYNHLVTSLIIKPQFYAFRWLSLLLSQEFPLPDVINIWDSLFADTNGQTLSLLPYICLAMLYLQRKTLLSSDFSGCVRLLQNYPDSDVSLLVVTAISIRDGQLQVQASKCHKRTLSDKLRDLSSLLRK